jgi:hypothetical protein
VEAGSFWTRQINMKILLIVITALVPSIASAQDTRTQRVRAAETVNDAACDRVAATLKLTNAKVTATTLVPAGPFTPPAEGTATPRPITGLPAFCRVQLTLTPSSDSDIKTEVWMPLTGWNGKFRRLQWCVTPDRFSGALGEALRRGYAAASGYRPHGPGAEWAAGHPEKIID